MLGKISMPGVLLIRIIIVGHGPTALANGAGRGVRAFFFRLLYVHFSLLPPSFWEMAQYRLKYCFKVLLNPKTTNKPTVE